MGIFDKLKSKSGAKNVVAAEKKTETKKAPAKATKADKEEAKPVVRGELAKEDSGQAHRVLVAPVFTEKASLLQASGKYVFLVARHATKVEVAAAVRDLYGVKPTSVRMMVVQGKTVRFGKYSGKEKDVKKAIVTLKKGDSIAVME